MAAVAVAALRGVEGDPLFFGIGTDVGNVGNLSDARLADVMAGCAVLLVDWLPGVRQRLVDALGLKRGRLEIHDPLSDAIKRGEVERVGRRARADCRALVALFD